jgi:hypothetical protein
MPPQIETGRSLHQVLASFFSFHNSDGVVCNQPAYVEKLEPAAADHVLRIEGGNGAIVRGANVVFRGLADVTNIKGAIVGGVEMELPFFVRFEILVEGEDVGQVWNGLLAIR